MVHVRALFLLFSLHWPRIEIHDFRRTHYDDFSVSRHRPKKVSGLSSLILMAPKNIRGAPERPYKLSRRPFFCPMDRLCHFVIDFQYPNRLCSTGIDFVVLQSRPSSTGIDSEVPESTPQYRNRLRSTGIASERGNALSPVFLSPGSIIIARKRSTLGGIFRCRGSM